MCIRLEPTKTIFPDTNTQMNSREQKKTSHPSFVYLCIHLRAEKITEKPRAKGTLIFLDLFIGQNRGQNFVHHLGVKWRLSFSCAVSHRIELARMYICRQYRGYVRSPTRQELREPNHPKDVNGSHHGISIDSLLVQPIRS
jgi:hypothetical protein